MNVTVIGIDFGATTCSVARWDGEIENKPDILLIDRDSLIDKNIMQSKVTIPNGKELRNFKLEADKSGRGEVFLRRIETKPEKRKYVFDQMAQCLLPLNHDIEYFLEVKREPITFKGGGNYLDEELAEGLDLLFAELYKRAAGYTAAEQVVVGLPLGYFEIGRERVINSLKKAGWVTGQEQVILFPEPLAIALRSGLDYKSEGKQRIMVADHGGGTLDMCIFDLEAAGGDFHIKVLSQKRCDIAGNLFDQYLMHWISEQDPRLYPGYGVDSAPQINDYSLWDAVEECKIKLSQSNQSILKHSACPFGQLEMTITRTDLETAISEGLELIQNHIDELLGEIKDNSVPVNKVFLAGGSARMPCIQQLFEKVISAAEVIKDYTGSGVLAQSLALVPKYQDIVERLSENTYGVWDYKNRAIVTIVEAGSLVTPKTDMIKAPRVKIKIEQSGKLAPLIIFHQQGGQWEPLYQMEVTAVANSVIDIVPRLDIGTGIIRTDLKVDGVDINTSMLKYADLKKFAPPVVCKGQIARYQNSNENYFIGNIRDIGTAKMGIEMAVGQLKDYMFYLHQYRTISENQKRLETNQQLSILRMGSIEGFAPVSLNDLIAKNTFVPLLDIEGNEFSLIIPTETKEAKFSEEQKHVDEGEANKDIKIYSSSPLNEVKSALADLINGEIDKAWEKGRVDAKRELLTKYIMIKTKKKNIEEEKIQRLTGDWSEPELDLMVDKVFRLQTTGEILHLLERKDDSVTEARKSRRALLKYFKG